MPSYLSVTESETEMAQKQGSNKKMRRATTTRTAATAKAGRRSGSARMRSTATRVGLPQGATPLFDGINTDRQAKQRQDTVVRAMMVRSVADLPKDSVEERAALTWFTIFSETPPAKGIFQTVTDSATKELNVAGMSDMDQRRARFGFSTARAAMKQVIFGEPATATAQA